MLNNIKKASLENSYRSGIIDYSEYSQELNNIEIKSENTIINSESEF